LKTQWQKAFRRQIPKKEEQTEEAHRKAMDRICADLIQKAFVQEAGDEVKYVWQIADDL
jgi:hypothetical protein